VKHNKICRANARGTNRLPRLVAVLMFMTTVSFMYRNKPPCYLVNQCRSSPNLLPQKCLQGHHNGDL